MSSISGKNNYNSGFNPLFISGCQLWLDAADTNTVSFSSGSNVSQWNDKSGSNNHAFRITGTPTYISNSIQLVGSNTDLLRTSNSLSLTIGSNTLFAVAKLNNAVGLNNFIAFPDIAFGVHTGANTVRYDNGILLAQGDQYDFGRNNYYVNGTFNPTTNTNSTYSNVHQLNAINQNTSGNTRINISDTFLSRYFTGNVYEILLYNNPLNTFQRQQIEGYLAFKWGLVASLPAIHSLKQHPPFTRLLTPIDVCSCALWLDSTDISGTGVNPAINAGIPVWFDKSGNGRNLSQATASNRPTFTESGVAFDGTTSFLATATNPNIRPTITYAVVTPNVIDTTRTVIKIGTSGGVNAEYHVRFQSTSIGSAYWNTTGAVSTPSLANPVAERQLLTTTWDGATTAFYRNGGADASSNAFTGTQFVGTHVLSIGSRNATASELFSGTMQEVIVYNRSPSSFERQQIEGYLGWRWGLQNSFPSNHLFKLYPPLTPAFAPPQFGSCRLWLDAADPDALTLSGNTITAWLDKSGNANNSGPQGGSFRTPTRTVAGINGLDVVQFSTDLQLINTHDLFSGRSFAIYSVIRRTAGVTSGIVTAWLCGRTSNTNTNCVCGFNGNSIIKFGFASNELNVAFPTYSATAEPPYLLGFYYTPGTRQIWNNGTLIGSDTNSTNIISVSNMQFGRFFNTYWRGQLGEVLVYNGVLTTPERQEIEGYLAAKWGLTGSLPNNHPYKKFRP